VGVVARRQAEALQRQARRRIERLVREAERRSPEAASRRARIRATSRAGRAAVKAREQAQDRMADALRRLLQEHVSIRDAAELIGVPYHEARRLIRAAEVAEGVGDHV
jgi:hypothetical protein